MYEREKHYIQNYECVNRIGAACKVSEEELEKRKENKKINQKIWDEKTIKEKKYHCELCDFTTMTPNKLKRHIDGFRHQLKLESFNKYGDDWKKHYINDNKKRYNENRKKKNF